MIRTILISTALLALAGAANAETIKVSVSGKTETAVRTEIAKATESVCRYAPVMEYNACVQETYRDAMAQMARIKALRTASLTF
jgi:hypothetical protein